LLGKFAGFGYGPDRVVPIAFHVDYFNDPWKDPFSSPKWSAREAAYCQVLGRKELYYTPLLLVDGKYDALGNAGAQVEAALKKALADPVLASLSVAWGASADRATKSKTRSKPAAKDDGPAKDADTEDAPRTRTLRASVRALSAALDGQELLLGIAVTEDPLTTQVASGENKGKKLVEHHVARSFAVEPVRLQSAHATMVEMRVELQAGWKPERCRVAVLLQDETTGRVHQADSLAWVEKGTGRN
jgi:hypothetical protein